MELERNVNFQPFQNPSRMIQNEWELPRIRHALKNIGLCAKLFVFSTKQLRSRAPGPNHKMKQRYSSLDVQVGLSKG